MTLNQTDKELPALWIFLPGLAVAGLALAGDARLEQVGGLAVWFSAWIGGVVLRLLRSSASFFFAGIVASFYWALFLLSLYGFLYLFLWTAPLLLIAAATSVSLATKRNPRGLVLSLAGFIVASAGILAWYAVGLPYTRARSQEWNAQRVDADKMALATLNKVAACAYAFRAAHPEIGFPGTLPLLGPSGSGCLAADELPLAPSGPFSSYHTSYEVVSDGRRNVGFRLTGEERSPRQTFTAFFVDESGIQRLAHYWGRPKSTGERSPRTEAVHFLPRDVVDRLAECLLERLGPSTQDAAVIRYRQTCLPREGPNEADSSVLVHGHRLVWRGVERDGGGSGYDLSIRPEPYGGEGIRSYLVVIRRDGNGLRSIAVHATPEDRHALPSDPRSTACEVRDDMCRNPS